MKLHNTAFIFLALSITFTCTYPLYSSAQTLNEQNTFSIEKLQAAQFAGLARESIKEIEHLILLFDKKSKSPEGLSESELAYIKKQININEVSVKEYSSSLSTEILKKISDIYNYKNKITVEKHVAAEGHTTSEENNIADSRGGSPSTNPSRNANPSDSVSPSHSRGASPSASVSPSHSRGASPIADEVSAPVSSSGCEANLKPIKEITQSIETDDQLLERLFSAKALDNSLAESIQHKLIKSQNFRKLFLKNITADETQKNPVLDDTVKYISNVVACYTYQKHPDSLHLFLPALSPLEFMPWINTHEMKSGVLERGYDDHINMYAFIADEIRYGLKKEIKNKIYYYARTEDIAKSLLNSIDTTNHCYFQYSLTFKTRHVLKNWLTLRTLEKLDKHLVSIKEKCRIKLSSHELP